LSGCDVRAVLPGYQSTVIALGPRRLLDTPEIGQLVLRRGVAPDGVAVTANTLSAPQRARAAFDNARKILEKEKPDYAKAAKELERAVSEYPGFAAAWNLMGRTRLALNDAVGSRDAFSKSIEADPKYVEPHMHLARLEADEGRWGDAINAITQVQALNPHLPEAHYLRAFAHFQLSEFDSAEQSALEVQKLSDLDRYPLTYYILGAIDARHGNFESAAVKLRQFLQTKPDAQLAESVTKILAEWALEDQKNGSAR
jgi:tetratricopeptide (TPR) repeat protein